MMATQPNFPTRHEISPETLINNGIALLCGYPSPRMDYLSAMLTSAYISASAQIVIAMSLHRIANALERPTTKPGNQVGFRLDDLT